jgi:exopolysaccharide biosynthesis predicted pyruvyltransferase EpsI
MDSISMSAGIHGHQTLGSYLKSLSEEIVYIPTPGNAGDSLIAHATYSLFRECSIPYRIADTSSVAVTDRVVVVGGGGNLVPPYQQIRNAMLSLHSSAKRLVILPSTISGNEDLLAELDSRADIFCREEVSFDHVKKHAPRANVFLLEDMAFAVDVSATLEGRPTGYLALVSDAIGERFHSRSPSPTISLRRVLGSMFFDLARNSRWKSRASGSTLDAFRTDVEQRGEVRRNNVDVSLIYSIGVGREDLAWFVARRLLMFLDSYEKIRTNRLHVAIGGALLGKSVEFFPNAYFKCKAVYDYSMRTRYRNVTWLA